MDYLVIDNECNGFVTIYSDKGRLCSDDLIVKTNIDDLIGWVDERDDSNREWDLEIDDMIIDGILVSDLIPNPEDPDDEIFTTAEFIYKEKVVAKFKIIGTSYEYKHTSVYRLAKIK